MKRIAGSLFPGPANFLPVRESLIGKRCPVGAGHDGKISILKIGDVRMEGHVGVPPVAFFPQNCAWKDISLSLRAHEMPNRVGHRWEKQDGQDGEAIESRMQRRGV